MSIARLDTSSVVYSLLQHSRSTSASVERSFFMVKKLLAENRSMSVENVKRYMTLHYDSCMWYTTAESNVVS